MEERILRRIEQLVEAAESRFPATLGEEWSGLGRAEAPPPPRSRVEQIEPERAEERYTPRSRIERVEPERGEERYTPRSRIERVEPERGEERYTPRTRLERIEPERLQEQYTPRSRLERIEPERERTPAPRAASTPPVSSRRVATMPSIEHLLKSRATLRQAILLQAILGPPKALRDRESADSFGS